ncbi:alkaline phosphatase family protein [Azoarcus sp. DN11]|uniref:alkaline phosphatase family protein n=1 Tax=Azoarcus sp. DN11 TaxID=356837 RepID=UPI000EB299D9|nr:alkaline phosphatase family protein [Azoarcus sp. DN11]AYH44680.1 phosphodiesterase [Azoarcus sp. DN11]
MPRVRHSDFADPERIALPQHAVLPDYRDGGLFALIRQLRDYLDGRPWQPPGAPAASRVDTGPRKLVFILIDGLGDMFLQRTGTNGALLAHRTGRLTSVFPSTTASAVTTTMTGLAPARHGLTGWFIRDRRFGGVIAPLPTMRRDRSPIRAPLTVPRLFSYRTLFQRRKHPSVFVSPRDLAFSPYSSRHSRGADTVAYKGLQGMIDAIVETIAASGTGRMLVHAYYPTFDGLSHAYGCNSNEVITHFGRIDAAFNQLIERLRGSNTDIVLTADHGFIDSPPECAMDLDTLPGLHGMLTAPLFGERRATFCAVRQGADRDFEQMARECLAGKATVSRSADLIGFGLFGPGKPHPRLQERVGSHALLMETGWTLRDHVPGEQEHAMIGVHGGLSADEMWIPLVEARC